MFDIVALVGGGGGRGLGEELDGKEIIVRK